MICHDKKLVFVHIAKCAGSTIIHHYFDRFFDLSVKAPVNTHTHMPGHAVAC
jgi:hypothetical protein